MLGLITSEPKQWQHQGLVVRDGHGCIWGRLAYRFLAETFGESQIVLGTDYPFALGDNRPLATLEQAGFSPATVEKITASNAKRFLGLK